MRQKTSGKFNIWKWLFLALLALLLATGIVLYTRVTTQREDTSQITSITSDEGTKIGSFTTTRDQLNETIAIYLEEYQTKGLTYKVYANNQQILFEGTYEVLGAEIPLYIYFQPSKLEDGSVLLTISEISAGTLSLTASAALSFVGNSISLPDFVTLDAEAGTVTVELTAIDNSQGIYVKANTIDLYNDQIIFDIYKSKS